MAFSVKGNPAGDTTIPPEQDLAAPEAGKQSLLALTIVWHPVLIRVGESVDLFDLHELGRTEISREKPAFCHLSAGTGGGLGHRSLSRTRASLEIFSVRPGRYEIKAGPAPSQIEVDGAFLSTAVTADLGDLDRGHLILLNNEIVLCLHLAAKRPRTAAAMPELVGTGQKIQLVREQAARFAKADVPVLIQGETGTGKGLLAKAIVSMSKRCREPFIAVNMASIPPGTASAELFGSHRGAFTGADSAKPGFFGVAEGGTLFLDEIGCAPFELQTALLRALGDREIQPLGAGKPKRVNVRVLAATDSDLLADVAAKKFSAALFQRLCECRIELPPLRCRREDIGLLLLHFLAEQASLPADGVNGTWLRARTVAQLAAGSWPGNVRGLRSAAQYMVMEYSSQENVQLDQTLQGFAGLRESRKALPTDGPPEVERRTALSDTAPSKNNVLISDKDLASAFLDNDRNYNRTALSLGIPKSTLHEMVARNPLIPKPGPLSDDELMQLLSVPGSSLRGVADRYNHSVHALKIRLSKLRKKL